MGQTFGAVVLAAGSGSRMKSKIAKQYLLLNGKPLVYYALKQFAESPVDRIVLVVSPGDEDYCRREILDRYGFSGVTVAAGGRERYLSVLAGLQALTDVDYVLIHDGARPCIDRELIGRTMEAVEQYDACIVGVPVKDTIKIADEGQFVRETPDRSLLWQVQTPQAFSYDLIRRAYEQVVAGGAQSVTDDAQVLELAFGKKSKLIFGSYRNIKVTTPEDLDVAELFLNKNKKYVK
jgi:2-C-methyl-D-erythritol 4-phosphate cytidylyltransferase